MDSSILSVNECIPEIEFTCSFRDSGALYDGKDTIDIELRKRPVNRDLTYPPMTGQCNAYPTFCDAGQSLWPSL